MAGRSRASAKAAGSSFERSQADYWAANLDDRIDRKVTTGAKDKGDLGGIRHPHTGARLVAECKNWAGQIKAGELIGEVEVETVNDGALAGFGIVKRKGVTDPGQQYVLTTVDHLIRLLKGA